MPSTYIFECCKVCKVPNSHNSCLLAAFIFKQYHQNCCNTVSQLYCGQNIVYCFPSVWRKKSEVGQKRRKREGNTNNFCLIYAIKHALDSNLAECLIIKLIWDLGCITPGFYFYSVGSGRSLLSVTATVARRSNFI